jgi:hypothetical protein
MAIEKTNSGVTAEELMEQAQTYASTWSSVGGPFDDGNTLARAEEEKAKFWSLVEQLVQERDDYRTAEEHQIALRKKSVEREQSLAAHVEHLDGLRKNVIEAIADDRLDVLDISFYRNEVQPPIPETSLARRDEVSRASGAAEFVSWLANQCESNGEVGEIFGMTLSGFTGDSRAASNLRAARAVFAEAKKLAEWKLEQVEGGKAQ